MSIFDKNSGLFSKFKNKFYNIKKYLEKNIKNLFTGANYINNLNFLQELEILMIQADMGTKTAKDIVIKINKYISKNNINSEKKIFMELTQHLETILIKNEQPLNIYKINNYPFVILVIGVNGVGKTTTIGKLCKIFKDQKKKVMLVAGDTFRDSAIDQLKIWGNLNNAPVIAQHKGADSASVVYDAICSAMSKNIDILIVDTAGRLHTKEYLIDDLKKIKYVANKIHHSLPNEILLVLDATIGQNTLYQAKTFHASIGVTGIVITKLDGTAKGGILFSIANELDIPFRYISTGEGIETLYPFNAKQFVEEIFK